VASSANSTQNWIGSLEDASFDRLAKLSAEHAAALLLDWPRWARPAQAMPCGLWQGWLILAGRGWGKTRVGAETVRAEVEGNRARHIGLIAETSADGRDIMVEGESGILATSSPWCKPEYEPSKRRITWANGATATLYDAREPDQLRGPQHDFLWFDDGILPYAESGPLEVGNGDNVVYAKYLIPDDKTLGDVTATFRCKFEPDGAESSFGPYTLASRTSVRFCARQAKVRYTGTRAVDWRVGTPRIDVTAGGGR
jgi:hypothetical protein